MAVRLTGVVVGDEPDAWAACGFEVVDGHVDLGDVRVRLVGAGGPRGILGWQLEGAPAVVVEDLHPVDVGVPDPGAAPRHPNGAVAVDHVVAATSDVERTTRALAQLGLVARRTVPGAREARLTYRFFLLGTCVLELIGPRQVDPDRTDRDARFAGLALVAPDPEVAHRLGVAGQPRPAIQPGRQIVTVRTEDLGISVPLALLSPRGGSDRVSRN